VVNDHIAIIVNSMDIGEMNVAKVVDIDIHPPLCLLQSGFVLDRCLLARYSMMLIIRMVHMSNVWTLLIALLVAA
jgi:hypothetical protein